MASLSAISGASRLTDAGIAKVSSGLLPAGTLLLSSRAPVGYLAIAAMPVAINQGFIALKCNERASNYFMLNWCQTNMAEIESRATGTTFAEISKQNFRPISVVLPPKAGNYADVQAIKGKLLYRRQPRAGSGDEKNAIVYFDLAEREEKTVLDDADTFEATADGKKMLRR